MTQTSGTEGPPHSLVGVRTGTDRDLDPNPSKLDVASSSPAPGTMPPPGRVGVPGQSRSGATDPKPEGSWWLPMWTYPNDSALLSQTKARPGRRLPVRGPRRGVPTASLPANQVRAVVGVQTSRAMLGIVGGAEANPTDQPEVRARTGSPDQRASTASRGQGTVVGRPSAGFRTRPIPPSPRRRPSRRCPGSGGMSRRSRLRSGGGLGTRSSGRSPSWWWSPWRS